MLAAATVFAVYLACLVYLMWQPQGASASPQMNSTTTRPSEFQSVLMARGVLQGFPDGNLYLGRAVSRAEVAKMFAVSLSLITRTPDVGVDTIFPDTETHWSRPYVYALVQRGLLLGYPDGTFAPDRPMAPGEYLLLMSRAYRSLGGEATEVTADLAARAPEWATRELGYVAGVLKAIGLDGQSLFDWGGSLSRGEAASLLYRFLVATGLAFDAKVQLRRVPIGPGATTLQAFIPSEPALWTCDSDTIDTIYVQDGNYVDEELVDTSRDAFIITDPNSGRVKLVVIPSN